PFTSSPRGRMGMRALLFASAAVLALAACDQADTDMAEAGAADEVVAEAEADVIEETEDGGPAQAAAAPAPAPGPGPGPGPGGPGGPGGGLQAQLDELRANNPRIGPDRTAEFTPDPNVAEQRAPNTWLLGGLEPTFPEQTRAPIPAETHTWRVEEVASGFNHPWGLEFMPDGSAIITERNGGTARIVSPDGTVSEPITGFPEVWAQGQGGLFDIALAPDFETSRKIYF